MKTILRWLISLLRYVYIFMLAVWFLAKLYVLRQTVFDKAQIWKVILSLVVPFVYGFTVRVLIKGKNMLKLRPAGAQKKQLYTLGLAAFSGAVLFLGGILIHRRPVLFTGNLQAVPSWLFNRTVQMGTVSGGLAVFVIPFAALATQRKLRMQTDLRAAIWLFAADIFSVSALLSQYEKVCFYGFLIMSFAFALQYFRLYYRELYGDALIQVPEIKGRSGRRKKKKSKKSDKKHKRIKRGKIFSGNGTKKSDTPKKSDRRMDAPQPSREFGNRRKTEKRPQRVLNRANTGSDQKKAAIQQRIPDDVCDGETDQNVQNAGYVEIADIEKMLEQEAEKAKREILSGADTDFYEKKQ